MEVAQVERDSLLRLRDVDAGREERRELLEVVMTSVYAVATARGDATGPARVEAPDPRAFAVLSDFFTRTIVSPCEVDADDGVFHTTDPSKMLADLLLGQLSRAGVALVSLDPAPDWERLQP